MAAPRSGFLLRFLVPSLLILPGISHAQWQVNGAPVCKAVGDDVTPQILTNGLGSTIITWKDHRGFNYDIWAQRLNSGYPAWTLDGVPICTGNGEHDQPVIASDGAGGAIIAWKDHRGSNYDIYAQRVNAAGVPQWAIDGVPVCTGPGEHDQPVIVGDGLNGAIIAWKDHRGSNYDIYAQHLNSTGGPRWTLDGQVVCNGPGEHDSPTIASDGADGAIIGWTDYRSVDALHPNNLDLYAQRMSSGGLALWTAQGVPICLAANMQSLPQIAADGAGGAIMAWSDLRGTDQDVYAQRVNATGAPLWAANGVAVCTAANDQMDVRFVSDGGGGAVIVWTDFRGSAKPYAQHVQGGGSVDPAWTVNGRLLTTLPNESGLPEIVSDGLGGGIVSWVTGSSLYAQHVPASGLTDPLWPATGQPLCDTGSPLLAAGHHRMVTDSFGGAIVTWDDQRSGAYDIYAQRVFSTGEVAAVPSEGMERVDLGSTYPNPSRGEVTIEFSLPNAARISANVYDLSGRLVRHLAERREFAAGSQHLVWDGKSGRGVAEKAGVYLVQMTAGGSSIVRPVTMLH